MESCLGLPEWESPNQISPFAQPVLFPAYGLPLPFVKKQKRPKAFPIWSGLFWVLATWSFNRIWNWLYSNTSEPSSTGVWELC